MDNNQPNVIPEVPNLNKRKKKYILVALISSLLIISLITALVYFFLIEKPQEDPFNLDTLNQKDEDIVTSSWKEEGMVIEGKYADPDVVRLDDGTYRMYFCIEPEVPGNNKEIYSATSVDGKTWEKEDGIRGNNMVFPDVVRLEDNTWRMYVQRDTVIQSFKSLDGLEWVHEDGIRIDKNNSNGSVFENVAAPTTLQKDDGTFMMVYVAKETQDYGPKVPSSGTRTLMWATSTDGLVWEKQGIAVDTINDSLLGFADGPDLITLSSGSTKLYFWGYYGVYESEFVENSFSEPKLVIEPLNPDNLAFVPDIPGDPTVIEIENTLHMYYGYHKKGIFYSTYTK